MLESIFSPLGTKIFLVIIIISIGLWGTLALIIGGEEATISRVTLDICKKHIIVAVLLGAWFGLIIGHIFWPN